MPEWQSVRIDVTTDQNPLQRQDINHGTRKEENDTTGGLGFGGFWREGGVPISITLSAESFPRHGDRVRMMGWAATAAAK